MNCFEEKVLLGLKSCNIILKKDSPVSIGLAVSGGADSVSLLLAMAAISKEYPVHIKVITVNHFMRPDEQTCTDAAFVMDLCESLKKQGYKVEASLVELKRGSVQSLCEKKKTGLEDAARTLRYEAFNQFIEKENLQALCLAHNQNDQLETLLMRFLQGAQVDHSCGIPEVREKFIRPLLNISRKEIEDYLKEKNQDYCTDLSNSDTKYLRNRIRNNLIPVLNDNFQGWQKAVLNGVKKAFEDSEILNKRQMECLKAIKRVDENTICFELDELCSLERGIQRRLLLDAINQILKTEGENRVPFVFIQEVLDLLNLRENNFTKQFNLIEIIKKNNRLFVKKLQNMNTELLFSVIIQEDGIYNLPFGSLEIRSKNQDNRIVSINGIESECCFKYPVQVRNAASDDYILSASNSLKKVSIILNDWKVPLEKKSLIPVFKELSSKEQPLICILGKSLGFKDWILRNDILGK